MLITRETETQRETMAEKRIYQVWKGSNVSHFPIFLCDSDVALYLLLTALCNSDIIFFFLQEIFVELCVSDME